VTNAKFIFIPSAAFTTLVRPMLAVPAVDPASAPVPTRSWAVAAAPNVTLSPREISEACQTKRPTATRGGPQ
jgi:hypothetical protein